jgi:hypothetical protein
MLRIANGRWSYRLRGVAYGAVLAAVGAIAIGLGFAAARDEQPFRRGKLVPSRSMDFVSEKVLPIATPLGGVIGSALAEWFWGRRRTPRCSGPRPTSVAAGLEVVDGRGH